MVNFENCVITFLESSLALLYVFARFRYHFVLNVKRLVIVGIVLLLLEFFVNPFK